ncbi:peptidase inhibitor family I36 protein [Micromonospora sp. LOL_021]|uniref:peptidase inhibitor family I36 protein n=1 Tax=Micromonospora sp. LOL_021 TaxID=3345417 RepID=UPI003A88EED5
MKLARKLLTWAMGATMALVVVTPSPAQAAYWDCPANAMCMWEHSGGNGLMVWVSVNTGNQPDLRAWSFDDKISSVRNTSAQGVCLYPDLNYDGNWYIFVPPYSGGGNVDPLANDQITSFRWAPSTSPPVC